MTLITHGLSALYLVLLAGFACAGAVPVWVITLYLGASSATFLVYLADKSAAKAGRWRVPEKTLHLLGLFGGWPGALAAQELFRHKTAKTSFRLVFWLTALVNSATALWLLAPPHLTAPLLQILHLPR